MLSPSDLPDFAEVRARVYCIDSYELAKYSYSYPVLGRYIDTHHDEIPELVHGMFCINTLSHLHAIDGECWVCIRTLDDKTINDIQLLIPLLSQTIEDDAVNTSTRYRDHYNEDYSEIKSYDISDTITQKVITKHTLTLVHAYQLYIPSIPRERPISLEIVSKLAFLRKYVIKFEPMTIAELSNICDIRFRMWREVYVNEMVALMQRARINDHDTSRAHMSAPSPDKQSREDDVLQEQGATTHEKSARDQDMRPMEMPIFVNYYAWFSLNNMDESAYAAPAIVKRFERSRASRAVRTSLARQIARIDDHRSKQDVRKIKDLRKQMREIARASMNVELTYVAIAMPMRAMSLFRCIGDHTQVDQFVLSMASAFILLHEVAGAIHRDPTDYDIGLPRMPIKRMTIISRDIAYNISGPFACVTDFSRAILNPYNYNVAPFLVSANHDVYAETQRPALVHYVKSVLKYEPVAREQEGASTNIITRAIHMAEHGSFDRAFTVLSILDMIAALHMRITACPQPIGMSRVPGIPASAQKWTGDATAKFVAHKSACLDILARELAREHSTASVIALEKQRNDPLRDFIALPIFAQYALASAPALALAPASDSRAKFEECVIDLDEISVSSRDILRINDHDLHNLRELAQIEIEDAGL